MSNTLMHIIASVGGLAGGFLGAWLVEAVDQVR